MTAALVCLAPCVALYRVMASASSSVAVETRLLLVGSALAVVLLVAIAQDTDSVDRSTAVVYTTYWWSITSSKSTSS